ncbi:MAG: alpha/beta hydrolase [Proteobacteria bacterium]|nr:alpha/beta hydrolase [Pseudomonadota bacterium]
MESRSIEVQGHKIQLAEAGAGDPVLYLHGFADLHSASTEMFPFHEKLAENFRLIAPAHPACAGSEEREDIDSIDDFVFHYIELLDVLGLDRFHLVGNCVGGWIAAEIAIRYPDKLRSLTLIGAPGLFVQGQSIADLFWVAQPEDGVYYNDLRSFLFSDAKSEIGNALYPDGRGEVDEELMRYKMFRFASRIGFTPPYFHDRKLIKRLSRYRGPALIVQGENDRFVPRAHAEAYAAGFASSRLEIIPNCGHSVVAERPEETAAAVGGFLKS